MFKKIASILLTVIFKLSLCAASVSAQNVTSKQDDYELVIDGVPFASAELDMSSIASYSARFTLVLTYPEELLGDSLLKEFEKKIEDNNNVYFTVDRKKVDIEMVNLLLNEPVLQISGSYKNMKSTSAISLIYNKHRYKLKFDPKAMPTPTPPIVELETGETKGNLYELIKAKIVTAEVTGVDIDGIWISVTNKKDVPVIVTFEKGLWFDSDLPTVQNMLGKSGYSIELEPKGTNIGVYDTACMNIDLKVPVASDTFTVKFDKDSMETRLAKEYHYATDIEFQCALWIITDKATDSELLNSLRYSDDTKAVTQADIKRAREIVKELRETED
jgi:hypothetical protein